MSLSELSSQLPEAAKDIRLNLDSVLSVEGSPDLSERQIFLIALATAYAAKQPEIIPALLSAAAPHFAGADYQAAKSAASIMAMNNVYYRFIHLVSDKSFASMPARLRMNVIGNPGIDKNDFELCCLAVSALNGCGMCMDAHANTLTKAGISKQAIQSSIRIASVMNAAALSLQLI